MASLKENSVCSLAKAKVFISIDFESDSKLPRLTIQKEKVIQWKEK